MIRILKTVIFALSAGMGVGISLIALYSVLDFPSRLKQLSTDIHFDTRMETALVFGAVLSSIVYHMHLCVSLGWILTGICFLVFGIFIGMLSASLTDIIGLVPVIMAKRENLSLKVLLFCILSGKTLGSVCYFLFFQR